MTITTAIAYLILIGGISAIIVLLSILIQGFDNLQSNVPRNTESNTNHSAKNQTYSHPVAAAIAAYDQNRDAQERDKTTRDAVTIRVITVTGAFAFIASLAASVSSFISLGQLREMQTASNLTRQSNEINRTALIAVQRAFVNLSSLEITSKLVPAGDGSSEKFVIIQPVIANDGNTSTARLRYAQGAFGVTLPSPPSPNGDVTFDGNVLTSRGTIINNRIVFGPPQGDNHPADPEELFSHDDVALRFSLGPRAKHVANIIGFAEREMKEAISRGWIYYVYGIIRYNDILPDTGEHVTKFCYYLERDITAEEFVLISNTCQYWNCTDDECDEDKKAYERRMNKFK